MLATIKHKEMRHSNIFAAILILSVCVLFTSCKKDDVSCSNEKDFCQLVDKQDFDATEPIIDDYLAGLKKNKPDENLEKIVDWLECMSCVTNVKIVCNSCIKTLPAQSELRVDFDSNGQKITMTMDITMGEPLKFRSYH